MLKSTARGLLVVVMFLLPVDLWSGTVTGTISSPMTGGGGANGAISFTLSQLAVSPGSFLAAPQTINCWTSRSGSVVGLPGDQAGAAPLVCADLGAGPFADNGYFGEYYLCHFHRGS